jgi:transcription termination factor 2
LAKISNCFFSHSQYWKKWIDNKSAGGQARLNALLKTLMLRRTKQHLIDNEGISIPSKTIELVSVKLDIEESNVYQKVLMYSQHLFTEYLYQKQKKDFEYVVKDKETQNKLSAMHKQYKKVYGNEEIRAHVILVLLLRLRQICCHPGLIDAVS